MPSAAPVSLQSQSSLQDAHQRLCDAEEQFDLLRHTVDGWSAWPVVRFEVSLLLAGITFDRRRAVPRGKRIRRAIQDVPRLARLKPARHVITTYTSGLVEPDGDRYRDIWFDDVVLAAGSTFKIETLNNPRFERRSRSALVPRDMSSAPIEIAAAILRRFRRFRDVENVSTHLRRVLCGALGLPSVDDAWIARRLQRFSSLRRAYRSLLRRVRPSYVLVVDASHHGLVAAAKEHGAIVLELQHGVTDRSNANYSWPASAASYRRTMPIPDRLLLYGEHWRRELAISDFWVGDLRVVGSPRIDRYRRENATRDDRRCRIVFTTQGFDFKKIIDFFTQFIERVGSTVAYHLTIKLHPIHDPDKAPYVEAFRGYGDRVDIVSGEDSPATFDLLQRAQLHVSVASASHYDAIGLGVPTIILPFKTHEIVLPLQRAGHAWLARTPEDLVNLVRTWPTLRVPHETREHYFRSDAPGNILHELGLDATSRDISSDAPNRR